MAAATAKLRGNVLDQYAVCDWQHLTVRPSRKEKLQLPVFSCVLEGSEPALSDWKNAFARAVDVQESAVTIVPAAVERPNETRLLIEIVTPNMDALETAVMVLLRTKVANRMITGLVSTNERHDVSPPISPIARNPSSSSPSLSPQLLPPPPSRGNSVLRV